jgi:hydrogenase expression/formation protein HypC
MCLAIPGQIVALAPGGHFATVEVSKVRRTINIDLLDGEPAAVGEWVLIHVGFAMNRISEEHAAEQLRLLAMLGEDAQAMAELDGYDFGQEGRDGQERQDGKEAALPAREIP